MRERVVVLAGCGEVSGKMKGMDRTPVGRLFIGIFLHSDLGMRSVTPVLQMSRSVKSLG